MVLKTKAFKTPEKSLKAKSLKESSALNEMTVSPKSSISESPIKLMPSRIDKKLTLGDKSEAVNVKVLQSSGNDAKNSETKTIYMPIKQEPNGKTADAIIVEDKDNVSVQNVELVEAEKKH